MAAGGRIRRVHGPFVSDHEVEDVVRFLKTQGQPEYLDAVTEEPDEDERRSLCRAMGGNGIAATICTTRRWPWWRATQGVHLLHPAPAADRL